MYHFAERLQTLYKLLQDEKSKEIFQARLTLDMEQSLPNLKRLTAQANIKEQPIISWNHPLKAVLKTLNREHKKIILYGTANTGTLFAEILQAERIDFYGFCGRDAKKYKNGLRRHPVLSPDELVAHGDEYYVLITVSDKKFYTEISQFLRERGYPENHIIPDWVDLHYIVYCAMISCTDENQYFEFPELYRQGTAFIDGGCYDCGTSRRFAEWCGGAYSSIIAFEPDTGNYDRCRKNMRENPLPNFQLVNAGLASQEGTVMFDAVNGATSRIIDDMSEPNVSETTANAILIRTVAIDDIIGDRTVGFIKMDIEGAELDALRGAKNTIVRDKPLLAICVYHRRGDAYAIMDYLHQLLPEYRFYLRHYSLTGGETVLYASVDL